MQKTLKKELSFSLDTLERYRAKYGRSASLDTNGHSTQPELQSAHTTAAAASPAKVRSPPPSLFKAQSPPRMTKLQELQQKKEAYMRAREHEREMEELQRGNKKSSISSAASSLDIPKPSSSSSNPTNNIASNGSTTGNGTSTPNSNGAAAANGKSSSSSSSTVTAAAQQAPKTAAGYSNWSNSHTTLSSQPWCAISDLMYFCDKYEFKTLSTRDLKTHQEIVAEVRALLSSKAPFDQRTRFPGNIHDPENLWVCIGRCASVEYHLQRIISIFRKPLNQLTPDKQRSTRQNFHLAVSELRLDISARISEVRLYDRLVFEREFRLEWQDES